MYRARSRLTSPTLTSNSGQLTYISDFLKLPIPAEKSSKFFKTSDMTSKNAVLASILMFFRQKFSSAATPLTPPPSVQFYCYFRPPECRRSPAVPWSALLCSSSQHSSQFLVLGRAECRGRWVHSWSAFFALTCTEVVALFWSDFRNCSVLLHTCRILGEVGLHLMTVRSKLKGPWYLTDFLDPGSLRVKHETTLKVI